jgi:squalene-associated FAD-dependent desaturase
VALERVAVCGAGLAGLAAALTLKEAGAHVELFERSRLLGGRATSFEIEGFEVDNGQHVFLACCTEFIQFARSVGMEQQLHMQERFDAVVLARNGKRGRLRAGALPAPFHLMPSFATYPFLSLAEKLSIARVIIGSPGATDVDTFEQWLQRHHQGTGERLAFWDPFFVPALNAPFDRVGATDALFVLRTAFLADAGAARFGFSRVPLAHLAEAAAARLDAVHRSTAVLSATPAEDGFGVTLTLRQAQGKGEQATYDAVVLALSPRQVANVLGDARKYGIERLDAYDPFPIVDVHLWHDGGPIGLDFAAALDSPLQWIFEKSPGYLCCSLSAADDYLLMPTAQLETFAWREVQTFLPSLKGATLARSAVTRNPEATWLPRIGATRTPQRTSDSRIAIAGSWTQTGWPDTMESAVRSGNRAAHVLLQAASSSASKVGAIA